MQPLWKPSWKKNCYFIRVAILVDAATADALLSIRCCFSNETNFFLFFLLKMFIFLLLFQNTVSSPKKPLVDICKSVFHLIIIVERKIISGSCCGVRVRHNLPRKKFFGFTWRWRMHSRKKSLYISNSLSKHWARLKLKQQKATRNERKGERKMLIANWVMNVTSYNMSCHLIYRQREKNVFM